MIFSGDALKQKHALITGASGGIGYATALLLIQMGADVTITGRNQAKLEELKREIISKKADANIHIHTANLTSDVERQKLVDTAEETFGTISLLINSAGILGNGKVEELSQTQIEQTMNLNYTVPILLSQQVFTKMKEKQEGAIINVASLSGLRGTFGGTAYCGSKFALIGFTQSFALEAIQHGIRVNAVCPGYVDTAMGRKSINDKADREGRTFEEQYQIASDGLPSGRITTPEEVANTIAFLLTDAAENIVGESVKISGGAVMR
ncbi:3-hydroxyacyl-CoA dehydrogenase [Paraliobacillus quinghaiensis]|uniref:3-hydroxyacyl-CoA dehydrogenase n=1 Tax=Paraliobacillus quinghaiensis TaxID=470815 RepID=A0A917TWF5_9BACI|nr:SDR family oxidoreductase [Paraliobacillus quinghaiensis]GGM40896.1 3-hydroxyacyl-CoA dehydrogenase [Paraliobacillus quinghaiensis]